MKINKKNRKKIYFIIAGFISLVLIVTVSYGRYIYNSINERYLLTKKFYFNSDKLDINRPIYQIENWSAVGEYFINFDLNSYLNNYEKTNYDIEYTLNYSCSNNIICELSKESGVIRGETNHDSFIASVSPNGQLQDGDTAVIEVKASAVKPYKKEISSRFIFNVGKIGLSYSIDDVAGNPYLNFNITNTIDYYIVDEAFLTYNVGDKIDTQTFSLLEQENKNKCTSALITLTFDPNIVALDMNSPAYLKRVSETFTTINGNSYVNSISFKMDAIDSEVVKFYKVNATQDYTYPITNDESIIAFTYSY